MPRYLLMHRHAAGECGAAFAAWKGFDSDLRGGTALASCPMGGHAVWWIIDAEGAGAAMAQLPPFVARRTESVEVREVRIP
jgi:hypothetical protein